MTPDTKRKAHEKLALFTTKIGYPDKWRDWSKLEIRRDDLLGNEMRAAAVVFDRGVNKLGGPIDRTEWLMTPQTINAYYNPPTNEIVFPAAILQPPFFDVTVDDAMNYGAIGAVIGHEVSHGFDDQGRRYDGTGNLHDWWAASDNEEFTRRAKAFGAQYDASSPLPGEHVNGELTMGENIADLAGVAMAYRAYKLSLQGQAGTGHRWLHGRPALLHRLGARLGAQVSRRRVAPAPADGSAQPERVPHQHHRVQPAGVLQRVRRQARRQDVPGPGGPRENLVVVGTPTGTRGFRLEGARRERAALRRP